MIDLVDRLRADRERGKRRRWELWTGAALGRTRLTQTGFMEFVGGHVGGAPAVPAADFADTFKELTTDG